MYDISTRIIELLPGCLVIPGATNCGVILNSEKAATEVYLVDSGCTEVDGDYIYDILDAYFKTQNKCWKLAAIINTHGHSDHSGGNLCLQQKTGCQIWISEDEAGYLTTPIHQSMEVWGGYPPKQLRTSFLKQNPSNPDFFFTDAFVKEFSNGSRLSFISIPGHSLQMTGVIFTSSSGKKVVFAGDAIFTRGELSKYWIPFMIRPSLFLESLKKLSEIQNVEWCIPGHGDFINRNLSETIELDNLAVLETQKLILNLLKEKKLTTEQLVKAVADKNEIKMGFTQYNLITSTLKSYLADLMDQELLTVTLEDNLFFWQAAE